MPKQAIRSNRSRAAQRPAFDKAPDCFIRNEQLQNVYIFGPGIMPDDIIKHIIEAMDQPKDDRKFGQLHLGPDPIARIARARRDWIDRSKELPGLTWQQLGTPPVLYSIGLITKDELELFEEKERGSEAGVRMLKQERVDPSGHSKKQLLEEQEMYRKNVWTLVESLGDDVKAKLKAKLAAEDRAKERIAERG